MRSYCSVYSFYSHLLLIHFSSIGYTSFEIHQSLSFLALGPLIRISVGLYLLFNTYYLIEKIIEQSIYIFCVLRLQLPHCNVSWNGKFLGLFNFYLSLPSIRFLNICSYHEYLFARMSFMLYLAENIHHSLEGILS